MDAYVVFNSEAVLDKLGFGPNNEAQYIVDSEVMKQCDPYVPFDSAGIYPAPGRLRDSVQFNTELGSGEIKYRTPYARYLYYHPEFNYQEAPMRGAYWADRAMQNGGKEKVVKALKNLIRKRSRR